MNDNVIIEIITNISYVVVLIALLITSIYVLKLCFEENKARRFERKRYIESLSDRDKAVIGRYIAYTDEH